MEDGGGGGGCLNKSTRFQTSGKKHEKLLWKTERKRLD